MGARPNDVSKDVVKSANLEISNDDNIYLWNGSRVRSTLCLILGACCQQRANHVTYRAYRFVCL